MIRTRDLVHRYGTEVVLDGVSLEVADREWVILAGPNGSGKTTLIRHFNGLLEPSAGEVFVNGESPTQNPVAARTSIGMVFQQPQTQFVAATIGADVAFGPENLGLSRPEIEERVSRALSAVNLEGREDERIDALSGGEQARLAVAGALAMEPDHLVLDEPFAGLDWPARQSLVSHLQRLSADGTGIVLVTHDVRDVLDSADRVVGIRDGSVVFDDSPGDARTTLGRVYVRVPGC